MCVHRCIESVLFISMQRSLHDTTHRPSETERGTDSGRRTVSYGGPAYQFEKKIRFLTSKIQKKNFSGRLFRPMWPGHQNNIGDQNIISVPQRPYNVTLPPPLLRTYTGLQILTGPWQNPLFFSFSLIYRYTRLIYESRQRVGGKIQLSMTRKKNPRAFFVKESV